LRLESKVSQQLPRPPDPVSLHVHRLAPLSEGRLEPSDGTLQCSYHGWRFNGSGKCVEIPQALDDKAKAVACSSSRSCVTSYSVQEAYGLIWVWPSAGPAAAAAAAAAPLPVSKGLVQTWDSKPGGHHKWYRRELPYSFDMLIENLADPCKCDGRSPLAPVTVGRRVET
jgi:phenylpropionate dioxygenase-like ring-hydroxylating dioxygenase large terminal subunit